jgi:hypothetical protein
VGHPPVPELWDRPRRRLGAAFQARALAQLALCDPPTPDPTALWPELPAARRPGLEPWLPPLRAGYFELQDFVAGHRGWAGVVRRHLAGGGYLEAVDLMFAVRRGLERHYLARLGREAKLRAGAARGRVAWDRGTQLYVFTYPR